MSEQFRARINLYTVAILVVLGLLGLRLIQLQLIEADTYSGKTRQSSIHEIVRIPARGLVYDRSGQLIADNEPTYTMQITPRFFDKTKSRLIGELMGVTEKEVLDKVEEARKYTPVRPSPIFREVPFSVVSKVEELGYEFPGVEFIVEQKRRYNRPRAAHILGYIKEITAKQLDKMKDDGYRRGDQIGQAGLEKFYEKEFRGKAGMELVMKNANGQVVTSYRGGKEDSQPISGYTFHLSIDAKTQALGEELFRNKRGAAVAIDPNNGEVIAMVSAPDYNPALLSGSVDRDVWIGLNQDPSRPLYNRATKSLQPPGSTWKPFMSLVSLQEGVIDENSKIVCNGGWGTHKCMGRHGAMDVRNSIKFSCNTFYYTLMTRLNFSHWTKWANTFGFGVLPPVDIAEKDKGTIPDSSFMDRRYGGRNRWKVGNLVIFGIGQGITVSPMQLARYIGAVANQGTLYAPRIVRYMYDSTGKKVYPKGEPAVKLNIKPEYFTAVREGMRSMAMERTKNVRWGDVVMAGKTGTAQAGRGRKDHSWFVGFAPFDNPQIAICVMVENAGFGATAAAPIAGLMMEQYITKAMSRPGMVSGIKGVTSQGFERKVDWTAGADTVVQILKRRKAAEKGQVLPQVKPLPQTTALTPNGQKPVTGAVQAPNTAPKPITPPKPAPSTPLPPTTEQQKPALPPATGRTTPTNRL